MVRVAQCTSSRNHTRWIVMCLEYFRTVQAALREFLLKKVSPFDKGGIAHWRTEQGLEYHIDVNGVMRLLLYRQLTSGITKIAKESRAIVPGGLGSRHSRSAWGASRALLALLETLACTSPMHGGFCRACCTICSCLCLVTGPRRVYVLLGGLER
jgi:hypothetical protein